MPQVSCGATPAPSLTLRVGMWDDFPGGLGPASAGFPGGLQREVSFFPGLRPEKRSLRAANQGDLWSADGRGQETRAQLNRVSFGAGFASLFWVCGRSSRIARTPGGFWSAMSKGTNVPETDDPEHGV